MQRKEGQVDSAEMCAEHGNNSQAQQGNRQITHMAPRPHPRALINHSWQTDGSGREVAGMTGLIVYTDDSFTTDKRKRIIIVQGRP